MNSTGLSTCPQCGAYARNGKTCGEKYEETLAIEYEAQTEIYIEDIRD